MAKLEDIISIPAACREFKVVRAAIYKAVERGDLEFVRFEGRNYLWRHQVYLYNWRGRPGVRPTKAELKQQQEANGDAEHQDGRGGNRYPRVHG